MVVDVLAEAGVKIADVDAVAVTVGPGGFTSLRASIALARGLALGAAIPCTAVSIGETFAQALPNLGARVLWTAITSRHERIFLESNDVVAAIDLSALSDPGYPVAVAGNAAIAVAARLAASGANVMLSDLRVARPQDLASAATRRLRGALPPRSSVPLYAEPPAAKPRVGARPRPL
jgi:tRNA threonylcarbamoyladenosine biosynthesis protein TsaB